MSELAEGSFAWVKYNSTCDVYGDCVTLGDGRFTVRNGNPLKTMAACNRVV